MSSEENIISESLTEATQGCVNDDSNYKIKKCIFLYKDRVKKKSILQV